MEFNKQNIINKVKEAQQSTVLMDEGLRAYMLKVYNYMASGILLTGLVSLIFFKLSVVTDADGSITALTSLGNTIFLSGFKWIIMLAPLGIVFYMSARINKMSASSAQTTFWIFASLMGLSLSSIFLVYTGASITIHLKPERKIVLPKLVNATIDPLASVTTDSLKNIKDTSPVNKIPEAM